MKLGSLKEGGRDGTLVVVSRDLTHGVRATGIAATLQQALEDWSHVAPRLNALYESLNAGDADGVFDLDVQALAAPLPRAYEFLDGSAYLPHVERVRRARGAEVPESFYTDPLMYQATSAGFHGPRDAVKVPSEDHGIDLEAEIVVVTDDVPMGVSPEQAAGHIQLVGLVNDVSLRNLIPGELAKGFGFLQSKPRSALSPVFVTPDELGPAWQDSKVHLPLLTHVNGAWFGRPEAGVDMQFNFAQLVAHAARTRPLGAATLVGSGTIANQDTSKGASCFAEQRTVETLRDGKPSTPFMSFGDVVRIEMLDAAGHSIFGAIEQRIEQAARPLSMEGAMDAMEEAGIDDGIVLHTYWRSSAAYRVRIGLGLKGLAWQDRPVHLVRDGGEQHHAAYQALNPQELVPTLLHDGHVLTQSLAILEYLDETFPQSPLLPADAVGRARVRALAQLVACDIHPINNLRVMQYLEGPLQLPGDARSAWTLHWMGQGFAAMEAMLAASGDTGTFCHGDRPGLADACLVPQLYNAHRFGLDLAPFLILRRIEAACLALDAFERARPENQPDALA